MKTPARRIAGLAFLAGLLLPCSQLTGCLSEDDGGSDTAVDPFPKPNGLKMIPLERDFESSFMFVEFDSAGNIERWPSLVLYVSKERGDTFTYAFDDPEQGYLIRYSETANPDSAGIWIVGTYHRPQRSVYATPILWVPQYPKEGATWPVGSGRVMELDSNGATYFTEVLLPSDTEEAPIFQGLQKHRTYRFKETAGDTVTLYYFRKGVGLMGLERSAGGRLIAAGSIHAFGNPSPR